MERISLLMPTTLTDSSPWNGFHNYDYNLLLRGAADGISNTLSFNVGMGMTLKCEIPAGKGVSVLYLKLSVIYRSTGSLCG